MSFWNFLSWLLGAQVRGSGSFSARVWTSDDIPPDAFSELAAGPPAGVLGTSVLEPAPAKPMWEQAKDQIAALQKIDPYFSDVSFLESATTTYEAALCAENDLNPDALGDAATQAFSDQLAGRIAQWRAAGQMRKVSDVKLDPPTLMKISVDGTQQRITVRFTGTAARYTLDALNGTVTDGSKQPSLFTEFAVFTRPAGTTTPAPIASGAPVHCPGCGAPVDPGRVTCPYCNTPLSGTGAAWQVDHLSASPYT